MGVSDWLGAQWAMRPWWMNVMFVFCIYMTFIYMPFDIFVKPLYQPIAAAEEVWFGVTLHGWAAKATEPLHWLIYGALAYGFWRMHPRMWPWAGIYCAQISIAMLLWNLLDPRGGGWIPGLVAAAFFAVPTVALLRARATFQAPRDRSPADPGRTELPIP